jgi:predicted Zn-ribbon and HTH transcriptional regulator
VRQDLALALRSGPATARDLSKAVGISEKDVAGHLGHLARSLRTHGEELTVVPPECLDCGFRFERREKLARPSRCPRCQSKRLSLPEFAIRPRRGRG